MRRKKSWWFPGSPIFIVHWGRPRTIVFNVNPGPNFRSIKMMPKIKKLNFDGLSDKKKRAQPANNPTPNKNNKLT